MSSQDSQGPRQEDESPSESPDQAAESVSAEGPEPRPRAGVGLRVAVYFLSVVLAISVAATEILRFIDGPEAVLAMTTPGAEVEPMLFLWLRLATLPVVLAVTLFFVARLDHGRLRDIGLGLPAGSGTHMMLATFLAAVPLVAWFLLAEPWVESSLEVFSGESLILDPWLPVGALDMVLLGVAFLGLAFLDELIFRGYVYSAFRERFSWVNAAGLANLLSIALFASHPQIGAAGLVNTFLLGLVLAAMREKTGSLLMPTFFLGIWNLVLGCGLSLPVSGSLFPRLYDHQLSGPEAVTGGEFGPEGSWLLTGLLLGLVMLLAWWVEKDREPESAPTDSTEASAAS